MKRAIDICVSGLVLALAAPFLPIIALLVKAESRGPALFRQQRVGRFGVPFDIYKFRTMQTGVSGPTVTSNADLRITGVGGWLRSTKLDELPQFLNVLKGDMSLIGPRPEVPEYVDLWPSRDRDLVLSVRPGISDPASVVFRRESELLSGQADPERFYRETILPQKVAMYVEYARTQTFAGDCRIAWRTLSAVVRG